MDDDRFRLHGDTVKPHSGAVRSRHVRQKSELPASVIRRLRSATPAPAVARQTAAYLGSRTARFPHSDPALTDLQSLDLKPQGTHETASMPGKASSRSSTKSATPQRQPQHEMTSSYDRASRSSPSHKAERDVQPRQGIGPKLTRSLRRKRSAKAVSWSRRIDRRGRALRHDQPLRHSPETSPAWDMHADGAASTNLPRLRKK